MTQYPEIKYDSLNYCEHETCQYSSETVDEFVHLVPGDTAHEMLEERKLFCCLYCLTRWSHEQFYGIGG